MAGYRLQRKLAAITTIAGIGLAGIGFAGVGLAGVAAAQSVGGGGSVQDAALVAQINAAYGTQFPVPAPAAPAAKAMMQVTPVAAGDTDG